MKDIFESIHSIHPSIQYRLVYEVNTERILIMNRNARTIETIVMVSLASVFLIFFMICCKFAFATTIPQQRPILRFNKNGEFKILQVNRLCMNFQ